jgi:hypothetical protein
MAVVPVTGVALRRGSGAFLVGGRANCRGAAGGLLALQVLTGFAGKDIGEIESDLAHRSDLLIMEVASRRKVSSLP